ncbi:MAG TPA: hypothetical protein VK631_17480 [Solirubrobacteraceae bacterium]|nr:hypothetical protein [Solirubrobacteraceae bacterium]
MPDVLEAIRRFQADPPDPSDAAVARAAARLRAEIAGKRPRRRRRRRIALALVPVALVAAGAGYALHEPARVDAGPACGNEAKISPHDLTVLSPDAGDPVEACAKLWRQGRWASGDGIRRAEAPPLTACVSPTGVVIVLPGSGPGFCERAGGSDLPPGYRERRERFAALFSALDARFSRGDGGGRNPNFECVSDYASAEAIVRRVLDEHGFADWRIEASDEPFSADRRCAALSYDERRKTITVIPL